jgi:hypothetical protein
MHTARSILALVPELTRYTAVVGSTPQIVGGEPRETRS